MKENKEVAMKRTIMALVLVLLFGLLGGCFVRSAAEFTPVGPYYASSGWYHYYRWNPHRYRYHRHYGHYRHYGHHHADHYRHDGHGGQRSHYVTVVKKAKKGEKHKSSARTSSKRSGHGARGGKRSR